MLYTFATHAPGQAALIISQFAAIFKLCANVKIAWHSLHCRLLGTCLSCKILHKIEALQQAMSRRTSRLLQSSSLMHLQGNLQNHLPNGGLENGQLALLDEWAHQTKQGFKVLH